MQPFCNHKYFELMTLPSFSVLSQAWSDEEHLQFHRDTLAYYEFVLEFLTSDNGAMARIIDTEPRHIEFLQKSIEWQKEAIENDEFSRKARAFCREKEAKERAENPPKPLTPDAITIGTAFKPETILSFKNN